MSPEALFVLLGAIASVAAVVMAYAAYRYSKLKDRGEDDLAKIRAMIELQLAPVNAALSKGDTRMAVLETKVDLMWVNLQKDMARIIHSPDPRRAHVDNLMNKIIDEQPFTPAEEDEMRDILKQIMMWEPGQDIGFPVNPGEQVVAAFLLRSLDYAPIRGRKLCGESSAGLAVSKDTRMTSRCRETLIPR